MFGGAEAVGTAHGDVVVFRIVVVGKGIERDGQLGDGAGWGLQLDVEVSERVVLEDGVDLDELGEVDASVEVEREGQGDGLDAGGVVGVWDEPVDLSGMDAGFL